MLNKRKRVFGKRWWRARNKPKIVPQQDKEELEYLDSCDYIIGVEPYYDLTIFQLSTSFRGLLYLGEALRGSFGQEAQRKCEIFFNFDKEKDKERLVCEDRHKSQLKSLFKKLKEEE